MPAPRPIHDARDGIGAAERRCLATGESRARETLLRFVVAPDGALTGTDVGNFASFLRLIVRRQGYFSAALGQFVRKRAFGHDFTHKITPPGDSSTGRFG